MPGTATKYSGLRADVPPTTRNFAFKKDILIAFVVSVLPLLAFSSLLLGLVFWYRVKPHGHNDPRLPDESLQSKGIIYISLSATVFTTLGSWSSTIAPLSLPFILAIASYPAARLMVRASDGNEGRNLPTPYQIALVLRVMSNSSLSSVWHCMVYISAKGRRAPMSSALTVMVCTLVLGTLQSMFIFATDTWLHVTTETIPITQFHPTTYSNTSFGIPSNCTVEEGRYIYECVEADSSFNSRSRMIQQALANASERAIIRVHGEGESRYAYIAPPSSIFHANLDYAATTFAAQTNCTPVTSRCLKREDIGSEETHYKCDFEMEGYIDTSQANGYSGLRHTTFTNAASSSDVADNPKLSNPFQFAILASVAADFGSPKYDDDDEVFSSPNQATVVVLFCQTTIFNVEYASINGSITHFSASPSNSSVTELITRTVQGTVTSEHFILQRTISDMWNSHTAQQVADGVSYTYDYAFLATSTTIIEPRPAEVAQLRSSVLVAAVPVAPLVCLLVANVLVVMLAILLTVGALMEVTKSDEVGDVQTRLSIDALVAAHFETSGKKLDVRKTEDMFEEYQGGDGPRVKVQKTADDGWKLVSCDS